ncbi:glutamate 5-kinase [Adlercreutzia mucosicola]|uniref:glutamate 5-kinase n=1 Tax=Adlercreutzia mucosicola TaxID=580026 RepID=UPI000420684D|nr:glutamate 5-kinase [Adlercreutzia mucosicola]MCR2036120.1 glutamate 5-kinase [Adlercreutzia mucosicola]MEB1813189.1 glutamate 5-kinase [Adlercreutzia mucosicola]
MEKPKDQARRRRLVVKIGSATLTTSESSIDYGFLDELAAQLDTVRREGWDVVVVTSAAIACGLEALGIARRPTDMPSLQAAASVGQSALSTAYAAAFGKRDMLTSVVLLTRRDTADRTAYLHARDTLCRLLELDVVPIVNENDTVSVEQIRFGDNDTLAALVACLIDADLMVILSDIDGLYTANPQIDSSATLIPCVDRVGRDILAAAGGAVSGVGSGGMITKIKAARVLMAAGIPMVICQGRRAGCVADAARGLPVGTLFTAPERPHEITPKKLWIALGDAVHGTLVVDEGARAALVERGKSLLSVGIREVRGSFDYDDIVDVADETGHVFARGRAAAGSDLVALACGKSRDEVAANAILSVLADKPVVHRDELVLFE